ncbi:MAG: xanthine dehydrogenase family protein molybdopterin-binding subunit [Coprothermobacterota bacterium]|nr:xanthine dehydrogenase family protein molybdopterin-binding subunit [Coprothermobacterota bacterium]
MELRIVGQSLPRTDATDKVSGRTIYSGDLIFPEMLHAKVLFSAHPHARLLSIDTSIAKQSPGVVAVLTAADVPCNEFGIYHFDQRVLAQDKVRSVGDPVALVIAETEDQAQRAQDQITVDYEILPAVFDPVIALMEGAPLVHEETGSNLLKSFQIRLGNLKEGFAQCDLIVEETFHTPFNEHAFLQPEAGVGLIDDQGRVTVYVGAQWIFDDVRQIAHTLQLPKERVREVLMPTGGAFGGREDISLQCLLALATYATRRPVKMIYTREESIRGHGKRHPFAMRGKIGVTREGKIHAMEVDLISDAGAYASTSIVVLENALSYAGGPYDVPNVSLSGRTAYTNNLPTMAMRGFGSAQVPMLYEALIDEAARRLEMDPITFRMKNLLQEGSILPTGNVIPPGVGIRETLRQAAAACGWQEEKGRWIPSERPAPPVGKLFGRGVATVYKNVGYSFGFDDQSEVWLEADVLPSGEVKSLQVKVGVTDSGQGLQSTLIQIAAEASGTLPERVVFVPPDTASTPDGGSNSASRQTYVTGKAILQAGRILRQKIESGERGPVSAQYHYYTQPVRPTTPYGSNGQCIPHHSYGYVTNIVDLLLNPATGEVEIQRVISAQDVGKAINPQIVLGQLSGGVVMGQGFALLEDFVLDQGRVKTPSLSTYIIPTVKDIPAHLFPILIESIPEPEGPFGAKGLGEMTMIGVAPAILNAIRDAIGIRLHAIPATPESIRQALRRS